MRIIDLDFYADKGGAIFLGYAGEHLSTVLNFHMPAELGNNDCVYVINFLKDGESSDKVVSHLAFKTRFDTNIVEYYIPSTIMGSDASTGVFHLEAYGMTTTIDDEVKYSILGKSTEFHYVIDDAITTDTSELNITLTSSEDITMQKLMTAINQLGDIQAALGSLDTLVGTLENFIEATEIYGQKDYIVSYSLPAQSEWTQITGGYTLEINTNLIPGYTFTNKTKIDIEPTIELYSVLENSFCTGLYAETEENGGIITYKFIALNKAPNTPIDVQLKLSEVNYPEE